MKKQNRTGFIIFSCQLAVLCFVILSFLLPSFSPATTISGGSWTTKAPMPTVRYGHGVGVLNNILYAIGGWQDPCSGLSTVEAYDPVSNTWSTKTSMPTGRQDPAVGVIDGIIYVSGGDRYCDGKTAVVEAYNPATNTWTTKASMPTVLRSSAYGVINGILYVAGGDNGTPSSKLYAYNPVLNTWTEKAQMPAVRDAATAGVINGILYVAGGKGPGYRIPEVWAYDPVADTWEIKAQIPTPRYTPASGVLNGLLYVLGGNNGGPEQLTNVEAYDPATDTWEVITSMTIPRAALAAGTVNGTLYAIGGGNSSGALATVEAYTPDVQYINQPPSADAGQDQTVHTGLLVTLSGSASSDPDANYPLSYSWTIVSKPSGSSAVLSDASAVNPSFTADLPGDYVVDLIVTDSLGSESTPDQVIISTYNSAPIADAGTDQAAIRVGDVVNLNGTQSYDENGDSIIYSWLILTKPAGSLAQLSDPASSSPAFTADVHGEYVIQLITSDLWSSSTPDTVTVSFENVKPVANAGDNQSVVQDEPVILNGIESNDANFDPLTYRWSFVSQPIGSLAEIVSPSSATTSFTSDMPGTYVISLVVNDGFVDSEPSNITVMVISYQDATTDILQESIDAINSLANNSFANTNLRSTLTNKVNAVLGKVDQGDYSDAINKLENDILKKTDGCAINGVPDKNDWITDCASQNHVYTIMMNAIEMLRRLM